MDLPCPFKIITNLQLVLVLAKQKLRIIINFQRNLKSSHGSHILKFHSDMNREANSRDEMPRLCFPKYQYPITSHILACIHNCTLNRIFQIIAKWKKRTKISKDQKYQYLITSHILVCMHNCSLLRICQISAKWKIL